MNQLNQSDLQLHVSILGWIHIGGAALFLLGGVLVFTLFTGIGVASGDSTAITILGLVGTAIGVVLAILTVLGIITGYGLLTHKPWGRILAMVLGMFGLVNFPVGTLIGIYTLWVLLQDSANSYFMSSESA